MHQTEFAVIEIGSHTVQLAVYGVDPVSGYRLMCEYDAKNRLRLIESLDAEQRLPDFVIQALIDTVRQFKRYCQSARVDLSHIDVVATSAIREARNRDGIIAAVAHETGLNVRILSEAQEAALAAAAVIERVALHDGVVFDLGGGALRLARVVHGQVGATTSRALGTLRLRQRFDLRTDAQYEALQHMIAQRLLDAPAALGVRGHARRLAAIGGVVRALSRMEQARHGEQETSTAREPLAAQTLMAWIERLRTLSPVEIRALPGVPAARVDTVLIGAMVAVEVLKAFGAPALEIADVSIRDGLALSHARTLAAAPAGIQAAVQPQ